MKSKLGYYLSWIFWLFIVGFIFFDLIGWMLNVLIFRGPAEVFILLALGTWAVLIVLDLINKRRIKHGQEVYNAQEVDFDSAVKKQIRNMAQWLHEAFPKEYHMAPWSMVADTRPAKNPQEFMVILVDDQHKLLYPIPVSTIKHILSDANVLEQKGVKEFEAIEILELSFRESEYTVNYSKQKDGKTNAS
jgi:hypothetical protein